MNEFFAKAPKSTDTMERVGTLIHKLLEQYEQQAQAGRLIMTAQMLLAELQQQQYASVNGPSEKVTVVIPASSIPAREPYPVVEKQPAPAPVQVVVAAPMLVNTVAPRVDEPEVLVVAAPVKEEICVEEPAKPQAPVSRPLSFDPVAEVPTLAQQDRGKAELNESMADNIESLNERLRVEKIELGSMLQGSPIRDLKKAIGINDRYLFINELFRGDETMYERSLKTINGFSILPEAEYWIQRELKVKLGWNEQSESVHQFDQLVKRRFS